MARTLKMNMQGDQFEKFLDVVHNVYTSRSELLKRFMDPRRDIDDECGYPSWDVQIPTDQYQRLYDREAVAARVVEVFPKESWQVQPSVYEDENPEIETAFEKAWLELCQHMSLSAGMNYHKEETGNPVWEYLQRVDILSGIGQYGVLFLGLDDGLPLDQPVRGLKVTDSVGMGMTYGPQNLSGGEGSGLKLMYMRAFPESVVQITQFESNVNNPRFGHPVKYQISFNDPRETSNTGIGLTQATLDVHWTRVLHVADGLRSSEVFGTPRMKPVFNRLYDLRKLYSGSAEMYWRGAFPGLSLETHPSMGGDTDFDVDTTRDQIEQYMNGLQRYLALQGLTAKSLTVQVVDPTPQINTQIEAICIKIGVPKRIFMGSERGELASSQDDASWNDRIRERQNYYLTPRMIVPFINRLIWLGILPAPKSFSVYWPDLVAQTATEKANITFKLSQSLAQYVSSGANQVMSKLDWLTKVFGLKEKEALAVIENLKDEPVIATNPSRSPLVPADKGANLPEVSPDDPTKGV